MPGFGACGARGGRPLPPALPRCAGKGAERSRSILGGRGEERYPCPARGAWGRSNQVKGAASPLPSPVRCSGYALRAACGLGQALELVSARLSARVKNVLTTIDYYPTLSYYCREFVKQDSYHFYEKLYRSLSFLHGQINQEEKHFETKLFDKFSLEQ